MGIYHYAPVREVKWRFKHFTLPWEKQIVNDIFDASDWISARGEPTVWGNGAFLIEDAKTGRLLILTSPGTKYLQ